MSVNPELLGAGKVNIAVEDAYQRVTYHETKVVPYYAPDGSLTIFSSAVSALPYAGDNAVLSVGRMTILSSDETIGNCRATATGVRSHGNKPSEVLWQSEGQVELSVGHGMSIRGINELLIFGRVRASSMHLTLHGLWNVHNRYLEKDRFIDVDDRVRINTHKRLVNVDGRPISMTRGSFRIFSFLAGVPNQAVELGEVDRICNESEYSVLGRTQPSIINRLAATVDTLLPDGYLLESQNRRLTLWTP